MLSNEYIRNFLELNRHVKSIKHRHRRGQTSCYLCLPGFEDFRQGYGWNCLGVRPPMKVTCQLCTPDLGEEHGEWNCLKYDTPMKVRHRLMDMNLCRACTMPHGANAECSYHKILCGNRGDSCRRCGLLDHVFWTCDGGPHPGSQFERKEKGDKDKSNEVCKQHNCNEIEQKCKKQESLVENKSLKVSPTSSSTESALSVIEDKFKKLENKFESLLNKKMESVKSDMKEMQVKFLHEVAENKNFKKSVTAEKANNLEKCHKDNESPLDQKTKDYIKNLESKLLEKNNLIKTQEGEIKKLQSEMEIKYDSNNHQNSKLIQQVKSLEEMLFAKDKSLAEFRKTNIILQNDVKDLINLLAKLFPELREIDSNLDNSSVLKMLEKLIEELQSESKLKTELENIKTELSKEREIVKLRDKEITKLKEYITSYKVSNSNNENTLKNLRGNYTKLDKGYKSNIYALNCQITEIKTDLNANKLKVEDSNKQISLLETENKQLKHSVKLLEKENDQLEAWLLEKRAEEDNEAQTFEETSTNLTDDNLDNSNQRAEIFDEGAHESAEFEEYTEGFSEYAENCDESALHFNESSREYDAYEMVNHDYENDEQLDNHEYENYEQPDNYEYEDYSYSYDEQADNDDCAQEDENEYEDGDIMQTMVTDKKGETKSLYDLYMSLGEELKEQVEYYRYSRSKNMLESLKDLQLIY